MGRIRQAAHATAKAEYQPQRSRVRRETRDQAHSLRTEEPALLASINLARHQLRHSGLSPHDLAIAEDELAHRSADVGASTALQIGQLHQDAQAKLVDLSEGQSQAEGGYVAALRKEALKHQQDVADHQREEAERFKNGILKKRVEQQLGLSSSGSSSGLSPTQERAHSQSQHNAAFYAKQYFQASKGGVKDKTGTEVIPAGPHAWDDQIWNSLAEKVAKQKGVDNVTDAQHAVQAIREHVQPGTAQAGALPQQSPLQALLRVAAAGTAPETPKPLQSIEQFGLSLLGHHR
jgi:hypothetical protein